MLLTLTFSKKTNASNFELNMIFFSRKTNFDQTELELFYIIILRYSVSFKSRKRNRGVDQWGHSLNEPVEGIVDYKNWRKIARYPMTCPCCVPSRTKFTEEKNKHLSIFFSFNPNEHQILHHENIGKKIFHFFFVGST